MGLRPTIATLDAPPDLMSARIRTTTGVRTFALAVIIGIEALPMKGRIASGLDPQVGGYNILPEAAGEEVVSA